MTTTSSDHTTLMDTSGAPSSITTTNGGTNIDSSSCTSRTHKLSKFYKWCPHDDYLLVKAVERGMSAEEIRGTIKFERPFTIEEITERWLAILYDPMIAQTTARHLVVLQNLKNYKRVPWSSEENQIIFKEAEIHQDVPLNFELIYDKYRDCFHPSRCPKTLEAHYQRMRRKGIIREYLAKSGSSPSSVVSQAISNTTANVGDDMDEDFYENKSFSEVEKEILNAPLSNDLEMRAQNMYTIENKVAEKNELKKIHKLEKESDVDEEVKETKKIKLNLTEEDVIAVFDGMQTKLPVRKSISIIGRKNSSHPVDIDLSMESEDIGKISRKQAVLTLTYSIEEKPSVKTIVATGQSDNNLERIAEVEDLSGCVDESNSKRVVFNFILKNVGKRSILVNGQPVESGCEAPVPHQSLVQFPGGLKFVFKWITSGFERWYQLNKTALESSTTHAMPTTTSEDKMIE
ncbi:hypothetical protein FDP41_004784 [Naegleria fowleri]|uniref:Microspherule protein N-terminal domain-containing protein n=1 Tax=Naegleria fowleri TaxID=5763 RepID=A0A6A5BT57_NAEFO|nr:uncharacterized protein FDP41_004784 [Naegleria fowleri]KAF0976109.1 hypothetical protein FDP41_004784 [Naegleria fowleri]CAG4718768.1 unnamed protein product [Naegleria fowleri]